MISIARDDVMSANKKKATSGEESDPHEILASPGGRTSDFLSPKWH